MIYLRVKLENYWFKLMASKKHNYTILNNINSPNDIRKLDRETLKTLANEVRNSDAANGDNWMAMFHNSGLANYSFSRTRFAMDTYRNYKAGQKVTYDICAGYHNSTQGDMKINYSGYNSQCTAFIMEIKQ